MKLLKHAPIAICKIYFLINKSAMVEVENKRDSDDGMDYYDVHIMYNESVPNGTTCNIYSNKTLFLCKYWHVSNNRSHVDESNILEQLIGRITNNIYYHNFITNFFMYSLNGANFEKMFSLFCFW